VEVPFSARFHFARSGRNPDGKPVEGLRTVRFDVPWSTGFVSNASAAPAGFRHQPVMLAEVVALLALSPPGVLLDATLGAAGHARALLDAAPQLTLIGLDQDPAAVAAASSVLAPYGSRAQVTHGSFAEIPRLVEGLREEGVPGLSAVLFDLGVSSPQLDQAERGFSYRHDGPLDMRMDPSQALSAGDVVNTWPERALVQLLRENGEGRFASRIARAIVTSRPVDSTGRLADVVRSAIPAAARRTGGHPARRTFQAIRIAVNRELLILPGAIDAALDALVPAGRCVVIAYHSGEDRIAKDRFRRAATGDCQCPPGLPCVCGAVPTARLLTRRALRPTELEVAANHRAESARLRAVERLLVDSGTPEARTA
jgi:16S rRNA (cytosine1402-N4)-methyltransferase